jgi:3-hexulose-6-phosphate synthase/6-phospho-3-hexuloisomerase
MVAPKRTPGGIPAVQVALDFLDTERALNCARDAVAGGATRIEAGTPLIKSEGLDCVRRLRAEFPDATIVADLKTMDAGRIEMEAASKAGADVAVVLGGASESTVRECIEAGRNFGIAVAMDLLGAADPVARAAEAQAWGIDEIHVHLPIDEQMQGRTVLDELRAVRAAVSVPVGAAGGLHSGNVVDAVAAGADILVIGGSITKSEDAAAATREIVEALATGRARAPSLFQRAGEGQILEVLKKVSAANLSDAMHRGGVLQGIRPIAPGLRMAGRAVTVRTCPGDWAKPVEAIDRAGPGDVIVIDAGGVPPAVWGELATQSARTRGVEGVVIDGAIRDSGDIRALAFAAFARHVTPHAGEPKGFGEIGAAVTVGGTRVSPGDWLLGDDDGVVAVPRERAVEFANRALDVLERENRIRAEIRAGSTLSKVLELLRWEKAK